MGLLSAKSLINRRNLTSAGGTGGSAGFQARRYSVGGPRLRVFLPLRAPLFGCAAASFCALATFAQDANYTSVNATPGKPVQLSYHASAHKSDCSPAPLPTVRIVEAPKSGILTVRPAVLTTNKIAGCPGLKTPVQVIFYMASTGYAGLDHTKYEVTDENGQVATYDVTITVKAAQPAQSPPAGEAGDRHL